MNIQPRENYTLPIDPITLARFMVLKGAAELVDAFSAIPEGHLRESIVSHAQAIAFTYDEARQNGAAIPDPLDLAARASSPRNGFAKPLALPPGQTAPQTAQEARQTPPADRPGVKTQTPGSAAVKLRLLGKSPQEIAADLDMDLGDVQAALREARAAGVKFKALTKPPVGEREKSNTYNTDWNAMGLPARGRVEAGALKLSLDPQRYLELKAILLAMKQQNKPWAEIVTACKPVPEDMLWRWVYQARAAGYDISTKTDDRPAHEPEAPPKRILPRYSDYPGSQQATLDRAAAKRGISGEAYLERCERIVQLRMAGHGGKAIAREVGEGEVMVKDQISRAMHVHGAKFPPLPHARKRV